MAGRAFLGLFEADQFIGEMADVLPFERAVLGGAMNDSTQKLPQLLEDEFLTDINRLVWRAIHQARAASGHSDPLEVHAALLAMGEFERAGGASYLSLQLVESSIQVFMLDYARVIRAAATRRKQAQLASDLGRDGMPEAEIQARLKAMPGPLGGALFDPADTWAEIVRSWETERIRTGYSRLDEMTGGLGLSDFWIIGARTSHGKTAAAVDLAIRLAQRGIAVDFLTLEDPSAAIVRRAVGNLAGIPTRRLKDGTVSDSEFQRAEDAVRQLQGLPLTVLDVAHLRSLSEQAVVGAVGASEAQVVIVDHLQQVMTPDDRGQRHYGLERVLHGLHAVALRDKKAVLVTAQLNRETEARQGPPRLSDLRDTGAAEMAGRTILLLYWPIRHDDQRDPQDYEMYLAKQHDGPTGLVPLRFEAAVGRFFDREVTP